MIKKSNFEEQLTQKMSRAYKILKILIKSYNSLLAIYKSSIRPNLDNGKIIYHEPNNGIFYQKTESIQYQATLAIAGIILVTS